MEPHPSPDPPWQFRGTFHHRYTHFRQVLNVYELWHYGQAPQIPVPGVWQAITELCQLPMATLRGGS
ncbi:MAG: hypothetical protein HC919_10235 [Oscillatoriales cyanobacterium SM2_2_1]|nr:hypothetical protein [Oscillatoriales cyanobacterium SM2_2_1]